MKLLSTHQRAAQWLAACAVLSSLVISTSVFAGGDHDHHGEHQDQQNQTLSAAQLSSNNIEQSVASQQTFYQQLQVPAKVTANPQAMAHINSPISGILLATYAEQGETVKKGQLLAIVKSADAAERKAAYLIAKEKLELQQDILNRQRQLKESGLITEQQLFSYESDLKAAQIALKQQQYALKALQLPIPNNDQNLDRFEIRSPINGVIIEKRLSLGELVSIDTDSKHHQLFEIVDAKRFLLQLYLPATSKVTPGQTVILGQSRYQIEWLDAKLIGQNQLAYVRLSGDDFKIGQWLQAGVILSQRTIPVAVKSHALQFEHGQSLLYQITNHDGELNAEVKPVKTGASDNGWTEILAGLEQGDSYVSTNSFLIKAWLNSAQAQHHH